MKTPKKRQPKNVNSVKNGANADGRHLSGQIQNNEGEWKCSACQKEILDESELAMECSLCPKKFCLPCIKLTASQYAAVQVLEREDFMWACKNCKARVDLTFSGPIEVDTSVIEKKLTSLVAKLEKEVDKLKKAVDTGLTETKNSFQKAAEEAQTQNQAIANGLAENRDSIEATIVEKVKKTFAEALVGQTNSSNEEFQTMVRKDGVTGYVRGIIEGQTTAQVREDNLREEREKNIVLYKAVEIQSDSVEGRKQHDLSLAKKLLSALEREDLEIKATLRLGQFNADGHDAGKCRPLKVVFHSKNDRDSVLRNTFKLGSTTDEELKNINVAYDLSPAERDARKAKIDEAKANSTDTHFWRVKGPPWNLYTVRVERRGRQGGS